MVVRFRLFFFFQAEDGIRDIGVTGVQTCALPIFIDEIHRLNRQIEEVLYPAMEDFAMDIVLGQGPSARTIRMDIPYFTLVGATTRTGLMTKPLLDRKSTRLNSSHANISYAVFCLKKKNNQL